MSTRAFFLNSDTAQYGEEEMNHVQKFLFDAGILNTIASGWEDWQANGDLKVTERGAGANMSIDIAPGWAILSTVRNAISFKIFAQSIGVTNLPVTANSTGGNRVDAVIIRLSRTLEPNNLTNNVVTLQVVPGNGTDAMTDEEIATIIDSDDDFLRLADIVVPDSTADITDGDIEDTRTRCVTTDVATYSPTVLRFRTLSTDPAEANLQEGDFWFNSVDGVLKYYNGVDTISLEPTTFLPGDGIDITLGTISAKLKAGGGLEFDSGEIKVAGFKFGGDGSDGALSITSGTTTINLSSAKYVVKNYTSISITGTGQLAFSNPHATGSAIMLRSQGNVTLTSSATPMIDASKLGGPGGNAIVATSNTDGNDGTACVLGQVTTNPGGKGRAGNSGTSGIAGVLPTAFTFALWAAQSIDIAWLRYFAQLWGGSGGGSGAVMSNVGGSHTSGKGGRGGGCLIIECGGYWNFTTASGISVAGEAAVAASCATRDAGGGGGGAGGFFMALYNFLTANTGTVTVTGGAPSNGCGTFNGSNQVGGVGGGCGGSNANAAASNVDNSQNSHVGTVGATGVSIVNKNTLFV